MNSSTANENPQAPTPPTLKIIPLTQADITAPVVLNYIIDGFMAEGVNTIAGQRGIGKTTAIMHMALLTCDAIEDCDMTGPDLPELRALHASQKRDVFYLTEDPTQIKSILHAYQKSRGTLDLSRFHIVEAQRWVYGTWHQFLNHWLATWIVPPGAPPWFIFDTQSSNFELDNPNDEPEVARLVSLLKNFFNHTAITSSIVGHVAKTSYNVESSKASGLTMKGSSAWEDNAMQNFVVYADFDDQQVPRYIETTKYRFVPEQRKIRYVTTQEELESINRLGKISPLKFNIAHLEFVSDEDVKNLKASQKQKHDTDKLDALQKETLEKLKEKIKKQFPLALGMKYVSSGGKSRLTFKDASHGDSDLYPRIVNLDVQNLGVSDKDGRRIIHIWINEGTWKRHTASTSTGSDVPYFVYTL